jgi:hypothetical protein
MSTIAWVLLTLAAIWVASIATVVLVVWAVVRRIRRSRALNRGILKARASLSAGPQRRVLSLRLQLADTLDSGRAAIDLAIRNEGRRGDLPRLFRRIEAEAQTLDSQLRLMESETVSAVLVDEIPLVSGQVDQLTEMVARLRASVASGIGDPSGETLAMLRADVDREIAALHAGMIELRRISSPDARFGAPSPERLQTKGATR